MKKAILLIVMVSLGLFNIYAQNATSSYDLKLKDKVKVLSKFDTINKKGVSIIKLGPTLFDNPGGIQLSAEKKVIWHTSFSFDYSYLFYLSPLRVADPSKGSTNITGNIYRGTLKFYFLPTYGRNLQGLYAGNMIFVKHYYFNGPDNYSNVAYRQEFLIKSLNVVFGWQRIIKNNIVYDLYLNGGVGIVRSGKAGMISEGNLPIPNINVGFKLGYCF